MTQTPPKPPSQPNRVISTIRVLLKIPFLPQRYRLVHLFSNYYASRRRDAHATLGSYVVGFDLSDAMQRAICFDFHENEIRSFFQSLLKPGQTFLDIGANVGYYSLIASSVIGDSGLVIAIEPVPSTASVIEKAVAQNKISNLKLHQIALSDSEGTLTLHVVAGAHRNSGMSSTVNHFDQPTVTVTVPKTSLDTFVEAQGIKKIDLIKIDIEGAEPFAFAGMEKTLAAFSPNIISEVSPLLLRKQGMESTAVTAFLSQRGYTIYQIKEHGLQTLDPDAIVPPPHIDIFATRSPHEFQHLVK